MSMNSPGYPWIDSGNEREGWLVVVTIAGPSYPRLQRIEGIDYWRVAPAWVIIRFTRNGNSGYTPYVPVTVSPMVAPKPRARNNTQIELLPYAEPGCEIAVQEINFL